MHDIIHRIGIKAPVAKVYKALATVKGVAGWWTEETEGSGRVGGKIEFRFRNDEGGIKGKMIVEVKKLVPRKEVRWRCVEGPKEWIGTDITFNLSVQDGMTIVLFGHRGWKKPVEFAAHCSMKWAVFMLSLRDFVEKGKGKPAPKDLKIDNWN